MNRWIGPSVIGAVLGASLLAYGEDITVTTYYPSPRGVYNELRANLLVLTDQKTKQEYSLTMESGRLLLTSLKDGKAFIVADVSEAGP